MLASGLRVCNFCEIPEPSALEETVPAAARGSALNNSGPDPWRGELNQRLQAYRGRRRKTATDGRQSALPFDDDASADARAQVILDEPATESRPDGFAFTIAIGRMAQKEADAQVLIDVSNPSSAGVEQGRIIEETEPSSCGLPVALLEERRRALLIDAACLAFAYGSFLALFGSLGGHFTLSKLSAAVCAFTFAFVYVQYFGLFTIFGGSTPGMMLSGLQVASATGDMPTPRQYLLRSIGYTLSAGTCFLGFLWVYWDEDELTWHDRISKTYLTEVENFLEEDGSHAATAR